MVTATGKPGKYLTEVTDGTHTITLDAPTSHGGGDNGLCPYALLESSLAGCIAITLRMFADTHDIPLSEDVQTQVAIRTVNDEVTFECSVTLPEGLDEKQKKRLLAAARGCPVHAVLKQPATLVLQEKDR